MEEDVGNPLILGRPFLATSRALIDMESGELMLRIRDECLVLQVYKAMHPPCDSMNCMKMEEVDPTRTKPPDKKDKRPKKKSKEEKGKTIDSKEFQFHYNSITWFETKFGVQPQPNHQNHPHHHQGHVLASPKRGQTRSSPFLPHPRTKPRPIHVGHPKHGTNAVPTWDIPPSHSLAHPSLHQHPSLALPMHIANIPKTRSCPPTTFPCHV
ncbi:hypothetical protein PIB30_108507 [Stylosanthes scabra]|uniref:Uncharacterized protein n=1 Tax=Stylosanthes scabra TaxID=79078 RepID=A0ABU6R085_9FABA|nr:hypothetical protein [Stylosanthes scabra]